MGTLHSTSAPAPLPQVIAERYAVVREIGHGGMGRVLLARDLKLDREVAVKVLGGGQSPDAVGRFEREARAAGALAHPNIVRVFDVGTSEGGPYIVSELLDGATLRARMANKPVPEAKAVDYAVQISRGLAAAHEHGIVHRDIKPENLFVTSEGTVKILDFGIAKLSQGSAEPRTESGAVMGTPAYMSPEQIRSEKADARSDIFSLGVVLYEMLAGEAPFDGRSSIEVGMAILQDEPPELDAAPEIARIVRRCLEKDPRDRYQTAKDLALELTTLAPAWPVRRERPKLATRILIGACVLAAALGVAWSLLRPGQPLPASSAAKPLLEAPSIAVLPFADMSPGKDQEYFSDGIAEEILNTLAQIKGLRVIGRTSSFSFKGKNAGLNAIAKELNVGTVLEGSVRKAGSRVRITAQLIESAGGSHLWSQEFDRELTDVFAVQDEIAAAVAAALRLKLLPAPITKDRRTGKSEAFDQYLLGTQFFRRNNAADFRRARDAFEKAVAIDPGYAPAWVGLAQATYWVADGGNVAAEIAEGQARALAAAEKAVALAPDLADAFAARGFVRAATFRNWPGARADFERALALGPDEVDVLRDYSLTVLRPLGRVEEALVVMRRVADLDPLNGRHWTSVGSFLTALGRMKEARAALDRSLQLNPESQFVRISLCEELLLNGEPQAALEAVQGSPVEPFRLQCQALAHHRLRLFDEEQQDLDALISRWADGAPYQIATVYAWRGDKDRAFEWLDRAYEQGDGGLTSVKIDPFLASLRADPRYTALLRNLGYQ